MEKLLKSNSNPEFAALCREGIELDNIVYYPSHWAHLHSNRYIFRGLAEVFKEDEEGIWIRTCDFSIKFNADGEIDYDTIYQESLPYWSYL